MSVRLPRPRRTPGRQPLLAAEACISSEVPALDKALTATFWAEKLEELEYTQVNQTPDQIAYWSGKSVLTKRGGEPATS